MNLLALTITCTHNHCRLKMLILDNPQSKAFLFVTESSILHITMLQRDFLLAVKEAHRRMEVLEQLQWIESLTVNYNVYVTIATIPTAVKGIIRYIGELPAEEGRKFGIELMVCTYKKAM